MGVPTGLRASLLVFASYLALSAAFSWPLATLDPDVLVTRHFDLYPSIWLMERAQAVFPSLHHDASAYPFGENLARVDSYVLLALAWITGGVVSAHALAGLVGWVGPAVGAWAAERCAHGSFGVARPWSWIAGCAYGFSGITATALLDGHIHHVLDPWLPLLLGAAWRATAGDGRWRHGLWAALFWSLALYTTAYAGVLGALLLGAVVLRGGIERLLPGLLLVALPAGMFYLWLFSSGSRWTDGYPPEASLVWRVGAVTLGGLAGWSDAFDLGFHSLSAPVGWTSFWLMMLAPVVLRGERGWRALMLVALAALFLSMGRTIRFGLTDGGWWSPAAWLVGLPGIEWFRFPVRFAWLYALCGGIVAARVAQMLAARVGPVVAAGLLVLCAGDAIVGTGLPWRLRGQVAAIPGAYAATPEDRAVLDLYAPSLDRFSSAEVEMWARVLSCYYQGIHGRPIFEVCIGTAVDSPREVVAEWLATGVLAPQPDFVAMRTLLGQLGVGAVVVHADVFRVSDRAVILEGLTALLGEPVAETRDGGEHVVAFLVPAAETLDVQGAWAAIR